MLSRHRAVLVLALTWTFVGRPTVAQEIKAARFTVERIDDLGAHGHMLVVHDAADERCHAWFISAGGLTAVGPLVLCEAQIKNHQQSKAEIAAMVERINHLLATKSATVELSRIQVMAVAPK